MAKPPMKNAAPPPSADDDDEDMGTDDGNQGTNDEEGGPSDDEEGEDQGEQPEVVATILKNPDGSWTLLHGDEDESEDNGEGSGGEEDEEEGTDDENDEGGEGGESGPKREVFQTEGELLKGVLDCIRADANGEYGDESGEKDFHGGYNEEAAPAAMSGAAKPAY